MNIVLLNATVEFGGVELHTIALAEFLAARGHDVTLAILSRDLISERLNGRRSFEVVQAPANHPFARLSFSDARKLLRGLPGDVCVFEKGSFECGSIGLDAAARLQFRRYITVEQLEADPMPPLTTRRRFGIIPGLGLWWHRRRIAGYLRSFGPSSIVCVSGAVKSRLRSQYWFSDRKVTVARNGVDVERFVPRDDWRRAKRREWGISETAFVFGAVGRLAPVKGFDVALKLFSELVRTDGGDLRFVLVGNGTEEDRLRVTVRELAITSTVTFVPFTDAPWEAMNAFDAFVMPSRNEGLPFAMMEAMACGCVPIAMRVGGIGEVLTDPNFGWLIEPGDDAGFASAMRQALRMTSSVRAQMGGEAREHITQHFNRAAQLSAIAAVIEKQ